MSDVIAQQPSVADYYDNLHIIGGAVLDEDSYQKHMTAPSVTPESTDAPVRSDDPFDAPQDFGEFAAHAAQSDQQEHRPECASFVTPVWNETSDSVEYIETSETYRPQTMRIFIGTSYPERCGSGSYRSSGSHRLSSGSYRTTSGSYRMSSGSFHTTSGSYRMSSDSFHTSGETSAVPTEPYTSYNSANPPLPIFDMTVLTQDAPYIGSLPWGMDVGGYGLNLI